MTRAVRRHESGTATVEFAIVLPVLMLILVGTLEWGRYFVVRESVIHAAREGARGGTLLDAAAGDACTVARAYLSTFGIRPGCSADMNYVIAGGGTTIPAVQVQLDVDFTPITGLPLALPTTMHIEAVMPSWRPPAGG
jgi:Flp pilus assembly protein TadG